MRTLLALPLAAVASHATETVSFRLPDACGEARVLQDFKSRYLLLVYQGVP
jgi:hypothetical protein